MKTIKAAGALYAGILFALLLFPPWSDGYHPEGADPLYSSIGHHWRFSFPYYWGYEEDICSDSNGRSVGCNGSSVWMPNEDAVIDYSTLRYEAALGFVGTLFLTLIVDLMSAPFSLAFSKLLMAIKSRSRR